MFSAYNPQWQVKFHYTALITPFVFIAAIAGTKRLISLASRFQLLDSKHINKYITWGIGSYLITISILWSFLHSPAPWNIKFDPSLYRPGEGRLFNR